MVRSNPSFVVNTRLLAEVQAAFRQRTNLIWILGGAGSGKTTICRVLSEKFGVPVYDMDAHIYGAYHGRFSPQRHPANYAWSTAENGLQWLLEMNWETFDSFNRAALPEYLDLLAHDLADLPGDDPVLIDGGIWHPGLLVQVLPKEQVLSLSAGDRLSAELWQEDEERLAMKAAVEQLPDAQEMWRKFLDFDRRITETIGDESLAHGISVYRRGDGEMAEESVCNIAQKIPLLQDISKHVS